MVKQFKVGEHWSECVVGNPAIHHGDEREKIL